MCVAKSKTTQQRGVRKSSSRHRCEEYPLTFACRLRGSPLATSGDAPLPKNVERVLGCFSFKIPGVPKQDVAKVFVADRDNVWFKSRVIGNLSPRSFINQKVLLQVSFGDHKSWRRRGPEYLENVESVSARRAEKVSTRST